MNKHQKYMGLSERYKQHAQEGIKIKSHPVHAHLELKGQLYSTALHTL